VRFPAKMTDKLFGPRRAPTPILLSHPLRAEGGRNEEMGPIREAGGRNEDAYPRSGRAITKSRPHSTDGRTLFIGGLSCTVAALPTFFSHPRRLPWAGGSLSSSSPPPRSHAPRRRSRRSDRPLGSSPRRARSPPYPSRQKRMEPPLPRAVARTRRLIG